MEILNQAQIESFWERGYIHYANVFSTEDALEIQREIWDELDNDFGIKEHDRETWRTPSWSPKKAKVSRTNEKVINEKFRDIINDLLGRGNWTEPSAWGGFLITFPNKTDQTWELTDKIWHWDFELFRRFKSNGLLIFSFYSDVKAQGGGTLIVSGSHRILDTYYNRLTAEQKSMKHGEQRKHFMKSHPWFNELTQAKLSTVDRKYKFMDQNTDVEGVPAQVVELTGRPGDVVFCHPRMIHAGAGINLNSYPRIMRVKFLW